MLDYWVLGRQRSFVIEVGGIPIDWTFDLFVYAAGDTNNQRGAGDRRGRETVDHGNWETGKTSNETKKDSFGRVSVSEGAPKLSLVERARRITRVLEKECIMWSSPACRQNPVRS